MSKHREIEYCCISAIGKKRKINQDNYYVVGKHRTLYQSDSVVVGRFLSTSGRIVAVFDGMGGESSGEMASLIAAENCSRFDKITNTPINSLKEMCIYLNRMVCSYSFDHGISSMGTTLAALKFDNDLVTACNLGDSSIFRINEVGLSKISKDHVFNDHTGGKLPLIQFLGLPEKEGVLTPHFYSCNVDPDDIFLICSDGLTDEVDADDIEKICLSEICAESAADHLVNLALKNGGNDNITVIVCRVTDCK